MAANSGKIKGILILFLVAAFGIAVGAWFLLWRTGQTATLQPPVVVIGLDGGTWDIILPLIEEGELKNMRKLMEEGAHGVLESAPPLSSPVI